MFKNTLIIAISLLCSSVVGADKHVFPERVLIPGGEYQLGCSKGDNLCDADEGLQGGELVTVPEFFMDASEASVAEFQLCVEAGECSLPFDFRRTHYCNYGAPGREEYPINCINWRQAYGYCTWRGGRLAYEVEWERAARARTTTPYPWGNQPASCENAVIDPGNRGEPDTETDGCWRDLSWPRNSFAPNSFGLFDMVGGTSEWVMDWYQKDAYQNYQAIGNLTGPKDGELKVIRGGSWDEKHWAQRVSNRYAKPITGNPDLYGSNGIRCVYPTQKSLK